MTIRVPDGGGLADLATPDASVSALPRRALARLGCDEPMAWTEYPGVRAGHRSVTRNAELQALNRRADPLPLARGIGRGAMPVRTTARGTPFQRPIRPSRR